jgi:hypothetical protein
MTTWNSISHQLTDASSWIRYKNRLKYTLWNSEDCEDAHTGTDIRIHCKIVEWWYYTYFIVHFVL